MDDNKDKQLDIVIKDYVAWIDMLKNTVTPEFSVAFHQTLRDLANDPAVRVVAIKSAHPKIFFAGANLKGMSGDFSDQNMPTVRTVVYEVSRLMDALEQFPKPTIAAVDGFALGGGCEFCLACDIIIASEKATFGFPEVNRGLVASAGGTFRLPRRIGKHKAMEMLLTGANYSAEEAFRLGLPNKVVPSENLYEEVQKMADRIAENAPIAVRGTKESVVDAEAAFDLQISNEVVDRSVWTCLRSADLIEGVIAFMQKRKPDFKGV